jgi:hypothetical protein
LTRSPARVVAELAVNALELQGTMVQEMELPTEALQTDDDDGVPSQHDLVVEDEQQQTDTLAALDTMRKNRHFCDVVLNVSTQ